jgi:hypothetical protein
VQTGFSNAVNVVIPAGTAAPAMPTLPSSLTTDSSGKAVITFSSGTLLPAQLSGLWTEVKYDTKTEYWNIGTGALSADGKSLSLLFDTTFNGKTVILRLFGFDPNDRETAMSNPISILVNIST